MSVDNELLEEAAAALEAAHDGLDGDETLQLRVLRVALRLRRAGGRPKVEPELWAKTLGLGGAAIAVTKVPTERHTVPMVEYPPPHAIAVRRKTPEEGPETHWWARLEDVR